MRFQEPRHTYLEMKVNLGPWQETQTWAKGMEKGCGRCDWIPWRGVWDEYNNIFWKCQKSSEQQNSMVKELL